MRLIDADTLIEKFGDLTVELWLDSVEEAEIVSLIGNAPTIEPKQGKWIDIPRKMFKCSECGQTYQVLEPKNFCSNCGARMK